VGLSRPETENYFWFLAVFFATVKCWAAKDVGCS
jgi:hypothetical protein